MAAVDGLAEVAGAAAEAEAIARSVVWQDAAAVDAASARVSKALSRDRESLGRPRISAVDASPNWQHRLAEMVDPSRDLLAQDPPANPVDAAAQAEADADAAVAVARLSLIEAHRAVLSARGLALRAGESVHVAARVRGYRPLPPGHLITTHGRALTDDVGAEF